MTAVFSEKITMSSDEPLTLLSLDQMVKRAWQKGYPSDSRVWLAGPAIRGRVTAREISIEYSPAGKETTT